MEVNVTLLIQLALFLVLLAGLSKFLFTPFLRIYDERERRIEGAAAEAARMVAGSDHKAEAIESTLRSAQDEARSILRELREKGVAKERAIIDEARTSAQLRLEGARTELRGTTERVREKLRAEAQDLAGEIVEKVLNRAA